MADKPKDPKPLRKIVYPFSKTETSDPAHSKSVEIKDAQEYFQALSKAEDGFYPIGYNGQWHGGVHFGAETGTALAQDDGIRCIADGEVIAYRIDGDAYPTVEYKTCAAATYSKSFVLVRHRLQLPPAPETSQATTANAGSAADNGDTADAPKQQVEPSLVLYSLYMHLRYWKAYRDDLGLKRPAFWDDTVYLAGNRAVDSDRKKNAFIPESGGTGMNLRDASNGIAGFVPRGAKLKLGAANTNSKNYFEIIEVVEGTTYPDSVVGLYVYKGTASSKEGLDPLGEPRKKDGTVYVLPKPIEITAGALIGHLGQYQRYSDMNPLAMTCTERPLVQLDVFAEPKELEEFVKKSRARDAQLDAKQKTLLHIQPGAQFVQPAEADVEIPAGEAILFVGEDAPNRWVKGHRGTIATVPRPDGFNSTTRAYGDGRIFISAVNPTDGSELTLEQFNALSDKSAYTQRKLLSPTAEVWLDREAADRFNTVSTPAKAWSQFPLQVANATGDSAEHSRIIAIKSAEATTAEADGTRWFLADAGGGATGTLQGWVREKDHPKVVLCSPWAWPGFVLMDTGSLQPQNLYARTLTQTKQVQESERNQMEALSQNAEQSSLFDALCKAIDTDGKDGITPLELRNALEKPWLAQSLSRLAIKHHSEWGGPMALWDAIDELIPATNKEDWTAEKKRIEVLQFWEHVKGKSGFPTEPKVHHLHPMGLIENISAWCFGDCLTMSQGQVTFDAEGNDIPGNAYFSRVLHWPGGASGVTIGRGYDMKERTQATVLQDLINAGVENAAAQSFSGGAGLSGVDANNFVTNNKTAFGEISCDAQKILFEDVVYPRYVTAAQKKYSQAIAAQQKAPSWDQLDQKIRDIAVDLTYQQGSIWNRQMPYIIGNDKEALATYIETTPELSQYEGGRRRARYLRSSK